MSENSEKCPLLEFLDDIFKLVVLSKQTVQNPQILSLQWNKTEKNGRFKLEKQKLTILISVSALVYIAHCTVLYHCV